MIEAKGKWNLLSFAVGRSQMADYYAELLFVPCKRANRIYCIAAGVIVSKKRDNVSLVARLHVSVWSKWTLK